MLSCLAVPSWRADRYLTLRLKKKIIMKFEIGGKMTL